MIEPLLNPRDIAFQLYEVVDAELLTTRPRFADYSRETFDAVLDTARGIATEHFAPHQKRNDTEEPRFENGGAVLNPEVKAAFAVYAESGLLAATHDAEIGGMQLPHTIATVAIAHFEAANIGTASYPLLTTGAANLIAVFGSPEQKARFLAPMLSGKFTGTMALTEPEAGSSLSDILTTAAPNDAGSYNITGTKMWISGGDHEIGENIVHLVLARIAGAPAGVKGISLFIVPKRLVGADGAVGALNNVKLAGLIHKMGWRGTTSCILNFGETGPSLGYLVGEPHKGLIYMFHMMNEARIGVGRAAMAMSYRAYLYSLTYARTRRQGRAPGERNPGRPQVPIIEHPDVRRMLLMQKATVEGALSLIIECARLVDEQETAPDEAARTRAKRLLDVLTPVAKSWPSSAGQDAISNAMQVLGGYGYAREYGVEQLYRDNRLNQIHEGTNGIQAIDLLGRKVTQETGASFTALVDCIRETIAATSLDVADLAEALRAGVVRMVETTQLLVRAATEGDPALALANASVYLDLVSRTVVAWLWLRQADTAARALARGASDADLAFYRGKLQAARYYFRWELTKTVTDGELLRRLDATTYEMQNDWF
jgi:alkylation response protein AidB-like acyl-CoA dehydrogenase